MDDLTKALLLEEAASSRAVADALFTAVNGRMPLVQSLVETGATTSDVLARYLARSEAPFLRQIAPLPELVARLPAGLCARLFAIPVRHDAITGTIDVVVADATDLHPANEIGFHLGAPVRLVRATPAAIEEALRKMRNDDLRREHAQRPSIPPSSQWGGEGGRSPPFMSSAETSGYGAEPHHEDMLYDSRPRAYTPSAVPRAAKPSLVIQPESAPPPGPAPPVRIRTPPWGTPVHTRTDPPPPSGYGSEIPLPLTRKTFYPAKVKGGTQRPPGLLDPSASPLGEGYSFDATGLRDLVEKSAPRIDELGPSLSLPSTGAGPSTGTGAGPGAGAGGSAQPPLGSFIPGPPPVPGSLTPSSYSAFAPQVAAEMSGVIAALKAAGSRDEVLELVLTGARLVATKVALFVVKKGGYLGWMCTPEFADRSQLQAVLIPLEAQSVFDRAIREDVYLGPIRYDDVHAPLLRILKNPTRDVAVVPIRVSGRTAVVIVADELGDTMIGTRRLEELARAAGDAFGRIVRTKR
ncbi:MAG: hypothetical protein KIT84_27595 [Labilithrix sp.]|nr:hypothetical protein [Labilithrix sp.]MCW5814823.1 hypothetical protein [Labilithrix sp.]